MAEDEDIRRARAQRARIDATAQAQIVADADPLAAVQASIAASKNKVNEKNAEIARIALEQAINTGDTAAAAAAAGKLADAEGVTGAAKTAAIGNARKDAQQTIESDRELSKPTEDPGDGNIWSYSVAEGRWKRVRVSPEKTEQQLLLDSLSGDGTPGNPYRYKKDGSLFNGSIGFGDYVNGVLKQSSGSKTDKDTAVSKADIDAAVAKAVAEATAANNAMIAQMKAEADAAKLATKQKASDKLTALFSAYGLETLAPFINTRIMADVSEEMLLLELYDRPEYQKRFPGMASLRKKSRTITEKEYMDIEKAMTQTARFFDLPKGFYDNPDDFGKLIGAEVSAKEYQDRLQVGQDLARTLNPSVKQQLIDFYGVGEGDLTAFVLDADKALPLIQKQAKAAQFVGIGRAAGFELRGITSGQAENIAGTESYAKLSERELAQALGQAGQLRRTQKRLSGIEGQDYSEQEALSAVIEGSPQALLASQQRAQREGARFSARGGVTGVSLRSTATPI